MPTQEEMQSAAEAAGETHPQSPADTERLSKCIANLMKQGTPRDDAQKQCLEHVKRGISPKGV